jgi:DNA phosphorothioation-associated putative methyltransferase
MSVKIRAAIASCKFGKTLPADFYVHISTLTQLPEELAHIVFDALTECCKKKGKIDFNLVKISKEGTDVSFLWYPDFDTDPHPGLKLSYRVDLTQKTCVKRTYSKTNPPILHRKETFVLPDYPHYEEFKEITRREEAAGLLNRKDIGYRKNWERILAMHSIR